MIPCVRAQVYACDCSSAGVSVRSLVSQLSSVAGSSGVGSVAVSSIVHVVGGVVGVVSTGEVVGVPPPPPTQPPGHGIDGIVTTGAVTMIVLVSLAVLPAVSVIV